MLCKKPYIKGSATFPCGQCLPCRFNRRRLWSHRIILESLKHEKNCFLTLTYDDDHLPDGGSLVPKHLQLFLKRLRMAYAFPIRYYAVGEYGDETERAHYHLALFGIDTTYDELIQDCWPYGHIFNGSLTVESAQYISGYVVKKMTAHDDPRLDGRYPEFCRMSLKPGIGHGALDELEEFFYTKIGSKMLAELGDVPTSLMHGGRMLPLGRYLRRKLRERLEIPQPSTSENPALQENIAEMQALFDASEARTRWQKLATYQKSVKSKIRSVEGRNKIFNGRNKKL